MVPVSNLALCEREARQSFTANNMSKSFNWLLFLHLKALSSESFERLPVFNKSAWRHYKTSPEADDWSNPSKEPRDASKSKYKANR